VDVTVARFAARQFLTMGLITTISMAVTHFKRHHQQMMEHAGQRQTTNQVLIRERRASCSVFALNFLFQVPLFIVIIIQMYRRMNDEQFE
jgi:hypothetical protein